MNSKERVHAALEGKPVDRWPVTVPYSELYYLDHFAELTGRPEWEWRKWTCADPSEHLVLYRTMAEKTPFEILRPLSAPSRERRARVEFPIRDGKPYLRDKLADTLVRLGPTKSHHATSDQSANETQYVYDRGDVDDRVKLVKAEDRLASGVNDYLEATVDALGADHFILSGGVVGTLYACHYHVGLTNLYAMLIEKPALIDYLCHKMLEQNMDIIRQLAAAGGDGIYIDDATATNDMISVAHYERFSLPYVCEMVREIHSLGHKAIIIYFGGIADRLEQIASIGADGLLFETSMKGYVNDVAQIAKRIGHRVTPFGNIDPLAVLQNGSDEELEAEIEGQVLAGEQARGFIISTGSPITPATPLSRVQRFIQLGRKHGRRASP